MIARDLVRRTPLRLALGFAALFLVSVSALFSVLYLDLSARLDSQIRAQAVEISDALRAVDEQRNFDDLRKAVVSESTSVLDSDVVIELVDTSGAYLAGNVRNAKPHPGWAQLNPSELRPNSASQRTEDHFFAVWKTVSNGSLMVGVSNRQERKTLSFMRRSFGYALAATLLTVGLSGAYLAGEAQRRIALFASTLSAVSNGHITARVPMSGSGDDIDRIGVQINRTLDHLEQLIGTVNQSSSDIAHDLKKPLGRLRQRLDVARRDFRTGEEFCSALDGAIADLDGAMQTFDALLRITQIEAGAARARFATLDLASVIDEVIDVYGAVAEDAGHRLEQFGVWKPAYVRGDRDLLLQLFANVIENSIIHCPAGARIATSLSETTAGFVVEVADSGPGIPADERGNVFRRLYRLERARSTPGTGLGLSLAAAISDLHGASIALEDNIPGLRFKISFPALA